MSVQFAAVKNRFNSLKWHDSKLVGLSLYKVDGEDRAKISLELIENLGVYTKAEMIFKNCAYFEADVYLQAKSMCADDIQGADCYLSSDWKAAVSVPGACDPILGDRKLEKFLHFCIGLIPPGGKINILAEDFELRIATNAAS
jgi:hypothetical protein